MDKPQIYLSYRNYLHRLEKRFSATTSTEIHQNLLSISPSQNEIAFIPLFYYVIVDDSV